TLPVGTDGVYYQTTGTVGTRQFIVQWNKLEAVNGDGTNKVIFEARLFEGSNRILFSYFDTAISDETTSPPDAARSAWVPRSGYATSTARQATEISGGHTIKR